MVERAMAESTAQPRAAPCRDVARQELELGARLADADDCSPVRTAVGRRLARERPRPRFGVVDHRRVELTRVRLRLSTAHRCRTWPLRRPGASSLTPAEATGHGCRLHPYRGRLTLELVSDEARVPLDVLELRTDAEGRIEIRFSDIDAALRSVNAGALDDYERLEIGHRAWAGAIELGRWRALMAEYHYRWVARGRGSPALFVHRHRTRDRGDDAHALAIEAHLARQEHDLTLVEDGVLTPRAFIDRHVWSPFRRIVERMLAESTAPSGPAPTAPSL
jgi:hypothetical protein